MAIITGFFRCSCGKMHARGGMNIGSVCTCGRNLHSQSIETRQSVITARKCARELAARQAK